MAITSDVRVARRYASALFEAARKDGEQGIESAGADLTVVAEMLASVKYLRAVLEQPLVSQERKMRVIEDAFGPRLGPTTLNYLTLLVRKRREPILAASISEFRRLADEHAGRVSASVEAPRALSDDQLQRLCAALEQRTGKTVLLTSTIDETMMGGLRVRIGDDVIDASLRARLEQIRLRLVHAR